MIDKQWCTTDNTKMATMQDSCLSISHLQKTQSLSGLFGKVVYSFFTQFIPIVVAFFSIPVLIKGLGNERFGVLSLGWVFLGYFTLFDLGLGRAATKFVSGYLAEGRQREVNSLIWIVWILMGVLGVLGGLVFFLCIPLLLGNTMQIPIELRSEARGAFVWIALSIPLVVCTTGMRSILEAYQRFDTVAFIATPSGLASYLIPMLSLFFTQRLDIIVLLLLISRIVFTLIYLRACFNVVPGIRAPKQFLKLEAVGSLLHFGGWLTVSNIIGPLLTYLDRFLVGSLLSVAAVTFYVTPYEAVRKLDVIPHSLTRVLFPTFSSLNVQDVKTSSGLFHRAIKLLFLIMLPITAILVTQANDILRLWINEEFAIHSTPVLRLLALGVLVNALAQVANSWIQSAGYANITAKFHLLELPLYLTMVWGLARMWNIAGVALAWSIRVLLDGLLLFWFAAKTFDQPLEKFGYLFPLLLVGVFVFALLFGANILAVNLLLRGVLVFIVMAVYLFIVWVWVLMPEERKLVLGLGS